MPITTPKVKEDLPVLRKKNSSESTNKEKMDEVELAKPAENDENGTKDIEDLSTPDPQKKVEECEIQDDKVSKDQPVVLKETKEEEVDLVVDRRYPKKITRSGKMY